MSFDNDLIVDSIRRLKAKGTVFEEGLSDAELARVQDRFDFIFPPELRFFLQSALPTTDYYPNWRSDSDDRLQQWFDRPLEGVLFDIEHSQFWHDDWGQRPTDLNEAIEVAKQRLSAVPKLIPIGDRIYLKCIPAHPPDHPIECGNPVFSINQTDALHAGRDFCDFLSWFSRPRSEFEKDEEAGTAPSPLYGKDYREIEFWTELVRRNVL